jgi:aspartyl-tRNA synthetase
MLRTYHLGELSQEHVGQQMVLCGWIERIREVGGVNFILIRDRYATLQLNVDASLISSVELGREYCIKVKGELHLRPEKDRRDDKINANFEFVCSELSVLNQSKLPAFIVEDKEEVNEDLRLKYRYLDLRRESMKTNLINRHKVIDCMRKTLNGREFLEVETPLMMKSTPEGSRDFLIPSRMYPGQFFALPQSPQLYKQILMVSGMDRYYQFARCFRDEDARGDRQMVHTQMDLEMSFVEEEDIFSVIEELLCTVFKNVLGKELAPGFKRIPYDECISRFGLDKPDLRFGMELYDLNEILKESPYDWFREVVSTGGRIAAITVPGGAKFSRKQLDAFSDYVKSYRVRGTFFCKVGDDGFSGGVAKHIPEEKCQELMQISNAKSGDLILFVADTFERASDAMGHLRNRVASMMDSILPESEHPYIPKDTYEFLWVTDFPLFEFDEDENRWQAMHHMFTLPKEEHIKYFETGELDKIYGRLYDLVLNGVELGSGSLRIHDAELQNKVFHLIGMKDEEIEQRFGFFLEALRHGAPPHGGIALGVARLMMTLFELDNMRDVIAFPNASSGRYLLDDSPTTVTEEQLDELGLKVKPQS